MHTESSGIISFLWLEKKEKEGEKRKKRSGAGCKQSLNNSRKIIANLGVDENCISSRWTRERYRGFTIKDSSHGRQSMRVSDKAGMR